MATVIQSPDFKPNDRIAVDCRVAVQRGTNELGGALGWEFLVNGLGLCGPMTKLENFVVPALGAPATIDITALAATPDAELGIGPTNIGIIAALCVRAHQTNAAGFRLFAGGAAPWTPGPFANGAAGGTFFPGTQAIYLGGQGSVVSGWPFTNLFRTFQVESLTAATGLVDIYFATKPFNL